MAVNYTFFTPISYAEVQPRTWQQKIEQGVDNYFYLGGRKAYVIDTKPIDGKIMVQLKEEKETTLRIALKVASFIILAVPLLIVKLVIRMFHKFQVMTPSDLIAKAESLPDSNIPDNKAAIVERKKQLLSAAYSMCMREIERGDHRDRPKNELAFTVGEILTKFAILNYNDKKLDPIKDKIRSFEIAQQILFGALSAQMYAAGVIDKCFDFTTMRNLLDIPKTIVEKKPFQSIEVIFQSKTTDEIYQKLNEAKLTAPQRIVLSQTLRYINGAHRHLIWNAKRTPSTAEVDLGKKLLLLPEKFLLSDADKDPKVLRELWELRYNDFPYYYETMMKEPAKVTNNWDWLFETAKKMPETYLRDICRCANKQAKTVDNHRSALQLALKAISLDKEMNDEIMVSLEDILEHNKYQQNQIESVAQKLVRLDPKGTNLNIAWFASIPNNLAAAMMRDNPRDLESVKGPLYLAREIAKIYEKGGIVSHHFRAIKENYALHTLLSSSALVQKAMEEEKAKIEKVGRSVTLTHEDLNRLDVCTNHIKRKLRDLLKSLDEMQELSPREYTAAVNEAKTLLQDAGNLYLALEKVSEQTQKEARTELDKVENLVKRCLDFAKNLFSKAAPKKS